MNESPRFRATDNLYHRYEDPDVLRKYLIEVLDFKEKEIKIQMTEGRGLEIQLERKLTMKEKGDIFKHFEDVKRKGRQRNRGAEEDD